MRLYLVSPTHYQRDRGLVAMGPQAAPNPGRLRRTLVKTTRYWTSGLTLPTLKALTPPDWKVALVDELIDDVDLDRPCDVVGITAMGPQIARAYDLADAFRARGRKVVLGGTWVTLAPHERSLAHADALVVGEAESVWAECLADLAAGKHRDVYRAEQWGPADATPPIDYRDLQLVRWTRFKLSPAYRQYFHWPLIFSKGCPRPCSYCAVQTFYGRTHRTRSVERVLDDVARIKALGGRKLLFLDDNPIAHPDKAKELFRALIGQGVTWASQCTIDIARDPEMLELAQRSGCVSLSIGLEALDEDVLKGVAKGWCSPASYEEDLNRIRGKGIQVIALMMMGLDGQTARSFEPTLRFLERSRVSLVKLFTPAPYPGTRFHADMQKAGRIVDDDWAHYDYGSILLSPKGMTADELRAGFDATYREFYSLSSIARRMLPVPRANRAEHAAYVLANLKTHHYLRKNPSAWGTLS